MYCKNCGSIVENNDKFCSVCGSKCKNGSVKIIASITGFISAHKKAVVYSASVLVILIIIIVAVNIFRKDESVSISETTGGNVTVNMQNTMMLNIDEFPATVQTDSVVLSGTAEIGWGTATVCINGDNVLDVSVGEKSMPWQTTVNLQKGKNKFVVTLSDGKGLSNTKIAEITYNKNVVFPEGTVLIKKSESGVFIRPEPQISDKYVMLIPMEDYTTQFICTGDEIQDAEGYLWVNVTTPANGTGWVRTDLIQQVN